MSVAFPTHVWKMANICKHIIVWLFSHMCAFSHTYVSKSKHVWKIALRCKYTNVFVFLSTFSLLLFFTCRVVTFANTSLTTVFVSFPPFLEMTDFSTSKIFEPDMRSFTFLNFYHYPLPHCFGLHLFCSCVVFLSHSGCAN